MQAHGGEFFTEGGDSRSGEFVGGLLGNAEGRADFAVGFAVTNAFRDLAETRGQGLHCQFEAFAGFQGRSKINHGRILGRNLLDSGLRRGELSGREVQVIHMMLVVADLPIVKISQGITHGICGVGGEVALCRIKQPGRIRKRLLGGKFDFRMGQAGDVRELAGDFGREGKKFVHPFFHDGERLSGRALVRQARGGEGCLVLGLSHFGVSVRESRVGVDAHTP